MDDLMSGEHDTELGTNKRQPRARMGKALFKSDELFRLLAENAQDMIFRYRLAPTRGFDYVSPASLAISGYTPEEHYADPDISRKIVYPEDRSMFEAAIAAPEALNMSMTLRWVRKDGGIVWTEHHNRPVYDEEGKLVAVEGIVRDITGRQQAEESLRQLAAIVEQSEEAIVSKTLDGRITSWNKGAEKLYGYSAAEAIGLPSSAFCPPDLLDELDQLTAKVRRGQATNNIETMRLRKDGERINVSLTCSPIKDAHGNIVGIATIGRDITEEKRAGAALRDSEEQLRYSQKMEAIGRLAGGIAHDFNNLLAVIILHSDLLRRRLAETDPIKNKIEEIRKAADRAASLTRQLLAFSRKQVMQPKVLDLNVVVGDTDRMLRRMIRADIELQSELDPELAQVKVDPGQITQVLLNLAVNAQDAMPGGGKLTITTTNVALDEDDVSTLTEMEPGQYVMLAVSDTGTGMEASTAARIFEPFFTTKEQGKGTGLGLSMVYGIIKQSGGDIAVESQPGAGTTFKIYLPQVITTEATTKQGLAESIDLMRGTETVLLVEDEAMMRNATREILELCGYHVLEAQDGVEALKVCKQYQKPIQLLLTDVVMPKMGGRALAEVLKGVRPATKVIYMSGYTDERHGIINEDMAFIEKPFTPEKLATKVREILDAPAEKQT